MKTFKAVMLFLCPLTECSTDDAPDPFLIEGTTVDNIQYDDLPGSRGFFRDLRVSTTHGVFTNLINGMIDLSQLSIDRIASIQQAIRDRSYPYTTEVFTAVRADTGKNSMAYKLYQLLCSDKAKKVIAESGYVPR